MIKNRRKVLNSDSNIKDFKNLMLKIIIVLTVCLGIATLIGLYTSQPFMIGGSFFMFMAFLFLNIFLYNLIIERYLKPLDYVLNRLHDYQPLPETLHSNWTNDEEFLELVLQRFQISQEVPLLFIELKVVEEDVIVLAALRTGKNLEYIQISEQDSLLGLFDANTGWNLLNRLSESARFMMPVHFEARLANYDYCYCDITLQPIARQGGVVWQGIISDATDNKLYQLALLEEKNFIEELFQASGAIFCVVDLNLHLLRYNQIFMETLQLNQEDTLKPDFWQMLLLGDEFLKFEESIQKSVSQNVVSHVESTLILQSGKRLLIDWSFAIIKMDEQSVVILTGNDVTEHAYLNSELHHINNSLMAKNSEIEMILSKQKQLFTLFERIRFTETLKELFFELNIGMKEILPFRNIFFFIKVDKLATGFEVFDAVGEFTEANKQTYFVEYKGVLGQVVQNGTDFYSGSITENEKYIEHHEGINSLLFVPVLHQDFLWGVIGIDSEEKNAFSTFDIEMLKLSASHIGLFLEEFNSRRELTEETKKLKGLHHTVSEMMYQRSRHEIAQRVIDEGLYTHLAIYGATTTGLQLLSETVQTSRDQFGTEHSMALIEQSVDSGTYQQTYLKSQQLYHCSQPINHGDSNFGVIYSIKERAQTSQEQEVMAIIAKQLAVIWRLNDLMEITEWEALIDPLTEIWNRRFIIRRIEEEHLNMIRSQTTAAMIMIDLSEFKSVNDTYGHEIGDEVLKSVARIFKDCLNPSDAIGRFGGDEFIILLPQTDRQGAEDCVKQMQNQLYKAPLTKLNLRIQADFGIVCVPEDTDSLMSALRIADLNMYHSKGMTKAPQN